MSFTPKDVPADLWGRMRVAAAQDGRTVEEVAAEALLQWLDRRQAQIDDLLHDAYGEVTE